ITSALSRTDSRNSPLRMERTMRLTPQAAAALQSEADAVESVICVAISADVPKVAVTHARAASERTPIPAPVHKRAAVAQGSGPPFPARSASRPAPVSMATANDTTPMNFSGYRNADHNGTTWENNSCRTPLRPSESSRARPPSTTNTLRSRRDQAPKNANPIAGIPQYRLS